MGYFTPSSTRIREILTKEKRIAEITHSDGSITILKVRILASGEYGLPTTRDLDYYRAFLKLLEETISRDGVFPEPIRLPTKTLIHYAGKQVSQKEVREVKNWIRRLHHTGIVGHVYNAQRGAYDELSGEPLFAKYRLRGQRLENNRMAETNYVWLASWFIKNYWHHYLRPIDFAFHKRLRKPIAKSLYPLLETGWYASNGQPYAKSYRDLCQEFLLTVHRAPSLIKQQLDPAHEELYREHFLAQWVYRKSTDKSDYIITYWPGEKFFQDQQARLERRERAAQLAKKAETASRPALAATTEGTLPSRYLLAEILEVCGDRQNQAAYFRLIQHYPEDLIRMALFETQQADREGRIKKSKGAYFTDTLKRLAHP
ncbi:MAG: hypothetical protein D6736_14040 [Nitrospinota bacterium]|nr:MAG: hypothetical protein D6736_14040 [Nitrospinota bacterium]